MSDESGSATMLADIPANCGMFTAEEVREYVSGEVAELSGDISGAISGLQSGLADAATKEYVDGLVCESSGDETIDIGSGYDSLSGLMFNQYGEFVKVVLESDLSFSGLSGYYNYIGSLSGMLQQARQMYPSSADDYALATEVARRSFCGNALYDALESGVGSGCGISGATWAVGATLEVFSGSWESVATLSQFLLDVARDGSVCNLISGCMSGTISGLRSGIADLENCCSNVSDLSGAVSDLNTAISSLNSTVSGISEALSGIAAAVSGLPQAIVDAIDEAAAEPDASPAMVRAAAKIEEVAQPKVQDMNADINPQVEAIADALDGVADDAMEVSDALDEVADATDGSTSETASAAASGANEASDTASNESTEVGAITFFP